VAINNVPIYNWTSYYTYSDASKLTLERYVLVAEGPENGNGYILD
jgi:hypothetical protein